jgi:hypothetical protein
MRPPHWTSTPEVFASNAALSTRVTRTARRGELRRIHGRIYTANLTDPLEEVVQRNRWQVVDLLFPGAVVSHRSALAPAPHEVGAESTLFLSGGYDRIIRLPGLRVRQMAAPGPLPGDQPLEGSLFRASPVRAILECLKVRRIRGSDSPALSQDQLRRALDQLLDGGIPGASVLQAARELAAPLKAESALERLQLLMGGGFSAPIPPVNAAPEPPPRRLPRSSDPWDPGVMRALESLRKALARWNVTPRADLSRTGSPWTTLAFLDAWASCALDGWTFDAAEGEGAVFQRRVPAGREDDAAILLATWQLLANPVEMSFSARDRSAEGFITGLQRRHRGIFQTAAATGGEGVGGGSPGDRKPTRSPDRIHATLLRGFELYSTLGEPLPRAAFLLCLITETNPFPQGTGVVARAAMNAELIASGERRILFAPAPAPPYLPALEALRRDGDASPLLRLLEAAHAKSAELDLRNRLNAAREIQGWGTGRRGWVRRFFPW